MFVSLQLSIMCSGYMVVDEAMLRKKIQDLQHYRRLGLSTAADIDKYESDLLKRVCISFLIQNHIDLPPLDTSESWTSRVSRVGQNTVPLRRAPVVWA